MIEMINLQTTCIFFVFLIPAAVFSAMEPDWTFLDSLYVLINSIGSMKDIQKNFFNFSYYSYMSVTTIGTNIQAYVSFHRSQPLTISGTLLQALLTHFQHHEFKIPKLRLSTKSASWVCANSATLKKHLRFNKVLFYSLLVFWPMLHGKFQDRKTYYFC
jgi:hypothetical protein